MCYLIIPDRELMLEGTDPSDRIRVFEFENKKKAMSWLEIQEWYERKKRVPFNSLNDFGCMTHQLFQPWTTENVFWNEFVEKTPKKLERIRDWPRYFRFCNGPSIWMCGIKAATDEEVHRIQQLNGGKSYLF